ncbi:hypothetical protein DERF_014239 [Dermatophagoides farinae]|uniref:Uncharacterized protein n=1 Tax=Dermatophagoides farinae TaxID=6954 RepID=A0A922KSM3_DERFA|nr:hypothetical protein DERF_014239 [Dermatophagoides farinae]
MSMIAVDEFVIVRSGSKRLEWPSTTENDCRESGTITLARFQIKMIPSSPPVIKYDWSLVTLTTRIG